MAKFRKADLVYLVFNDAGHVEVIKSCPDGVTVDTTDGTWTNKENPNSFFSGESCRKRKIGIDCRIAVNRWQRHGIVGVYSRNNITHLKMMVYSALRANEQDRPWAEY